MLPWGVVLFSVLGQPSHHRGSQGADYSAVGLARTMRGLQQGQGLGQGHCATMRIRFYGVRAGVPWQSL